MKSKSSYPCAPTLDPRKGKSNIGPGPKIPAGAGAPSTKGSIKYPTSPVKGGK